MYEQIHYVSIKLTDYCNLACKYCFEYKDSKELRTIFSIEKTKQLVKFLLTQNLSNVLEVKISGGEVSLTLPHLKSVIKELKKIERYRETKVECSVITNGSNMDGILSLIDKGYIDAESSKYSWDGIHSCSSRQPKNPIYTDDFFNENICKIGSSKHGKDILIAYALSKDTIDDLADSFRYAVEHGCTKLSYYYLFIPQYKGYYQDPEFLKKIEEQLYKVAEYYNSHYYDYENWNNLYYTTYIDKDSTIFRDNPCNFFGQMIYVDMHGKLYPCMLASSDGNYNKHPLSIGDIWNGFSRGRLEQFGKMYQNFHPCIGCTNYHCEQCPVMMQYKDQYLHEYLYDMCKVSEIEKKVFMDSHIMNDTIMKKIKKRMTLLRKQPTDYSYIPDTIFMSEATNETDVFESQKQ